MDDFRTPPQRRLRIEFSVNRHAKDRLREAYRIIRPMSLRFEVPETTEQISELDVPSVPLSSQVQG